MRSGSPPETISVALCTYNGARFLEEQLASLQAQIRCPDELIVCDDRSTDKTVQLLEAFARIAPFPVRIHVNPANLGSTMNFDRAMRLCTGSLIAFCDQDDIWHSTRLSACAEAFQDDPRLELVFSNGQLIDEAGTQIPGRLWTNSPSIPQSVNVSSTETCCRWSGTALLPAPPSCFALICASTFAPRPASGCMMAGLPPLRPASGVLDFWTNRSSGTAFIPSSRLGLGLGQRGELLANSHESIGSDRIGIGTR